MKGDFRVISDGVWGIVIHIQLSSHAVVGRQYKCSLWMDRRMMNAWMQ